MQGKFHFFGGTNLRLYSKYYEGGNKPWALYMKMCATFGVTADLGPVFMGLTLETGEIDDSDPTYGKPKDNMVEFNFLNDFTYCLKSCD